MARMPVEVVVLGGVSEDDVARAIVIANRVQAEFHYTVLGSRALKVTTQTSHLEHMCRCAALIPRSNEHTFPLPVGQRCEE